MISEIELERIASFKQFIESMPSLSAEEGLKCIETAKKAMLHGEVSVEGYYVAKEIILRKIGCASELVN